MEKEEIIISASGIVKAFGKHRALDDVSLEVPRGCVYGLLGPNGAGKTTLLRIINHITAPDQGAVTFEGAPLTQKSVERIGYLPEERGLYKKMKVGEQALYFARLKGLSKREATKNLKEWFDRLGIADWWGRKVEELSKGMAQKVQFIVTVLHRPPLLIFDEPFSGFDPVNAEVLKQEILRLRDEGSTILFSTHNMASVEEVCDHITLLNHGQNVLTGKVEELRRRHFADRYVLEFEGDRKVLEEELRTHGLIDDLRPLPPEKSGAPRLDIHLRQGVSRRDLLGRVNELVDIREFSPARASMNEIFIRTVSQSANTPQ